MFTAYLDDSGTSPSQNIAIATALLLPANLIGRLEREWDTLKSKEGFSCFHASAFVARNPKSEFAGWSDAKQKRVFERVQQISFKYGIRSFSFAVKKSDYDEVIPADWRDHLGRHHYTWAVRHVLSFLDGWRWGRPVALPSLEYVFSWMERRDKGRAEIENVMEQMDWVSAREGGEEDYKNYSFRSLGELAGLQCVDHISWVCYRTARHQLLGAPSHPLAEWAIREYGKDDWLNFLSVSRSSLAQWFEHEKRNQKAVDYKIIWAERRKR